MNIKLDLIIDSDDDPVDMKATLESMDGISDTVCCVTESVLSEKTPKKQTTSRDVRSVLKKSFKGSYGHTFDLEINNQELMDRLNKIGKGVLVELISYFISESLYLNSKDLSFKAQSVLDHLGEQSEEVVEQLRVSSLKRSHAMTRKFGYGVMINHRVRGKENLIVAKFDEKTLRYLQPVQVNDISNIVVSITRLNIYTGNGRLQIKGANETVAFGFGTMYSEVSLAAKKGFSENLNNNNGAANDDWVYLRIEATSLRMRGGKVVKYIIKTAGDE